jgi:DNA-directed RNA polymerase subunit RPC12/RpoP
MIYMTATRKYICMSCGDRFRAPDRRRVSREADDAALSQTQRGALGV